MKNLRIVFMGTPDFAVESLKAIIESGYEVAAVVTAPDKPAGRGRKLQESAVKKYALQQNLQVLQPTNLKSEDFLEELRSLNPNLQVVVAFRMLPKEVWQLPEYGTFNLHASLLPQYRGAAPINWAIINGEKLTGVSTFFIDEKIDTGDMILQEEVSITENETAGNLHDRLMKTGAELVIKTLEKIKKGDLSTSPQNNLQPLNAAFKLSKENTRIDWNWPMERIHNFIRGLSPFPAAWTVLQNNNEEFNLKIYDTAKEQSSHDLEPGSIIQEAKSVKIAVKGGFLELREIQLPGKRKMAVKDLLNGFSFSPNAKVV